uniref:Uncharacterized protein n=1 Tax=Caudovirales sp. ctFWA4 TaxID=2827628 RepID=A0A8S5LIR2_9CAUD|nr:MAG TPA: hypothetical protein [Caudovirales sp. ctFWA4]
MRLCSQKNFDCLVGGERKFLTYPVNITNCKRRSLQTAVKSTPIDSDCIGKSFFCCITFGDFAIQLVDIYMIHGSHLLSVIAFTRLHVSRIQPLVAFVNKKVAKMRTFLLQICNTGVILRL